MQFVRTNFLLVKNAVGKAIGYLTGAYLFTESSDNIVTEAGDKIITE